MKFDNVNDAAAWARTMVPEKRVEFMLKRFAEVSEKHGLISDISAGMAFFAGEEESERGPALPPICYIWLRACWRNSVDNMKDWHFPITMKMERDFTPDEWRQVLIT